MMGAKSNGAQVARAIQSFGAKLASDPRTALVTATNAQEENRAGVVSLRRVALDARAGLLPTRAAFLGAAAAAIRAAHAASAAGLG